MVFPKSTLVVTVCMHSDAFKINSETRVFSACYRRHVTISSTRGTREPESGQWLWKMMYMYGHIHWIVLASLADLNPTSLPLVSQRCRTWTRTSWVATLCYRETLFSSAWQWTEGMEIREPPMYKYTNSVKNRRIRMLEKQ